MRVAFFRACGGKTWRWLERPAFLYLEWYLLFPRRFQTINIIWPSSSSLETSSWINGENLRRCAEKTMLWATRSLRVALTFGGPLPSPWCVSISELNKNSTIKSLPSFLPGRKLLGTFCHLPKRHLCLTWPLSSALIGACIRSVRSHVAWVSSNYRRRVVVQVQPGFGPPYTSCSESLSEL